MNMFVYFALIGKVTKTERKIDISFNDETQLNYTRIYVADFVTDLEQLSLVWY